MIGADCSGARVLVTGASSGIGLATVEIFARNGATVALNHLPDDPRGPAGVRRLAEAGGAVIALPGRMARPEDIAETIFFLSVGAAYITGETITVDGGAM